MEFYAILPLAIGALLAQDVQITRDGADWVRTDSGVAASSPTRILKITTRGHLTVRGSNSEQVTYRLTERVRARSGDDAHRMFGSTLLSRRVENAVTLVSITPMAQVAVVTELEVG